MIFIKKDFKLEKYEITILEETCDAPLGFYES
jgi:hypothetical protein